MGIVGLLLAIALLMYLVYKGLDVVVMTIVCSLLIALTSGLDVLDSFKTAYMGNLGTMIGVLGAQFLGGAIIGSLYADTGAAYSIADWICKTVKVKDARKKNLVTVLMVMIVTIGLGYLGVNALVLLFLTYPICNEICRKYDWDSHFVPILVMTGPLANILPGAAQGYNIIPTTILGTHPMASAIPGFIACLAMFFLTLFYTTNIITKSQLAGEHYIETEELKKQDVKFDQFPKPIIAAIPLLSLFICFNVLNIGIEASMAVCVILSLALFWKYYPDVKKTFTSGVTNAAKTIIQFGALMGFAKVAMSTPTYDNIVRAVTSNTSTDPVIMTVISVALLTGISNSGTSGITASLNAFSDYYISRGIAPAIIHRTAALTAATLDTLPTNSGVIISLKLGGFTYKQSYFPIFMNTVVFPMVTVVAYIILIKLFPGIAAWPI